MAQPSDEGAERAASEPPSYDESQHTPPRAAPVRIGASSFNVLAAIRIAVLAALLIAVTLFIVAVVAPSRTGKPLGSGKPASPAGGPPKKQKVPANQAVGGRSLTGGSNAASFPVSELTSSSNAAHDCPHAPQNPGDRRADKRYLKIVNFNAEWLFLNGGSGFMTCPGPSCEWTVCEPPAPS